MGAIIKVKIDLNKIDKSKIYEGAKGKYYEMDIMINDKVDNYGQNVSVCNPTKSKDEQKVYLGNGKVVWVQGNIEVAPRDNQPAPVQATEEPKDDLPF